MGQPKGTSGNPNGRPKGTPNKVTATMRDWIMELLNDNRERLEEDFVKLTPKERLQVAERLMCYVLPKQQAISGVIENKPEKEERHYDLSKVPTELLCEVSKYILCDD